MVTAVTHHAQVHARLVMFQVMKEPALMFLPGLTLTMTAVPAVKHVTGLEPVLMMTPNVQPLTATPEHARPTPVISTLVERKVPVATVNSATMLTLIANMSVQATTLMTTVVPAVKCVTAQVVVLTMIPNVQPLTATPEHVLPIPVISTLVVKKVPVGIANSVMTLTLTVNMSVQAMTLITTVVPAVKCVTAQVVVLMMIPNVRFLNVTPEHAPLTPVISTLVVKKVTVGIANSAMIQTLNVNTLTQAMTHTVTVQVVIHATAQAVVLMTTPNVQLLTVTPELVVLVSVKSTPAERKVPVATVNSATMKILIANMSAQATTLMTTVVPAVKCVTAQAVVLMMIPNVQLLTATLEPAPLTPATSSLMVKRVILVLLAKNVMMLIVIVTP